MPGTEQGSQDSMDSMDIFAETSTSAATATATETSTKEEEQESTLVGAQLRVAPVSPAEYVSSGKQCATQLLPRCLITGGVCEIPYLTRMHTEQAAALLLQDMKLCSLIVTAVSVSPVPLPFPAAAAADVDGSDSAAEAFRLGATPFKFTPASTLRRRV